MISDRSLGEGGGGKLFLDTKYIFSYWLNQILCQLMVSPHSYFASCVLIDHHHLDRNLDPTMTFTLLFYVRRLPFVWEEWLLKEESRVRTRSEQFAFNMFRHLLSNILKVMTSLIKNIIATARDSWQCLMCYEF